MTSKAKRGSQPAQSERPSEEQRFKDAEEFLRTEGTSFEMFCAREFHRAGLKIDPHGYFTDKDAKHGGPTPREVDLRIVDTRYFQIGHNHTTSPKSKNVHLLGAIECKYAPTAWIGFEHCGAADSELERYLFTLYCSSWEDVPGEAFSGLSPLPVLEGFGRIHTSIKVVNDQGAAHSALSKVLKVAASDVRSLKATPLNYGRVVAIGFPIILVDGLLLSCKLDEQDRPQLTPVDCLMLATSRFAPGTAGQAGLSFFSKENDVVFCPVVTKKKLPEFARNLAETFDLIQIAFKMQCELELASAPKPKGKGPRAVF